MAVIDPKDMKVEKVQAEQVTNTPKGKREAKIVSKAHKRKKTLGDKFIDTFFNSDMASVKDYVIHDVAIPALKTFFYDVVKNGMYEALWGGRKPPDTQRDRDRSYVDYSSRSRGYDKPPWERDQTRDRVRQDRGRRARYDFRDLAMNSRGEAEDVLRTMDQYIGEYGEVTVADFLTFVGEDSDFPDAKWGWRSLRAAFVERGRDGWVFRLPEPIYLE